MAAKIALDDDIIIEINTGGGERPQGCMWNESVCTSSPEYRIVPGAHGQDHDHSDVELYCPRHYAVALARLVALHLPECEASISAHIVAYGSVDQ